ncbi:MAG: YARHG domain-containing protein [Acidobacteriota bacterium]|nr:YARHG domain-containing protein [Acidobacteriota bacterium]
MRNLVILFVLYGLFWCIPASAQDNLKKWESFDFAAKKLTAAQIRNLDLEELGRLRGIVFGRRGRIFKEKSIQEYLEKRAWYKPNPGYRNAMLSATERQNLDLIRLAEAEKHDFVQPGDLRLWQKKQIPEDKIYANSAADWRIMIAEIEAIHGKTFPDEPWLQKYFEERYWYKANPNYSAAALSPIERKNIEALNKKRDEQRKVAVSFGDMDKFQNLPLTEKMLEGVTLGELRMMRNEFWARRGRTFNVPGIRVQFEWQDWYRPAKDQKTVKLNPIEEQNVRLLETMEAKIRNKIATEAVSVELFDGMFTEDLRVLRNEIYARRGKVFKSKDLKEYFETQSWYKPDPNFKDEMLSEIEKKNLAVIKEAEDAAISKFSEAEG